MSRPLRIEFPGALYHILARGNARAAIFLDDEDREAFIDNLGRVCKHFDWHVVAWCLMDNHYHLLVETTRATLSRGMREVNGVYTQAYNRRHGRAGSVLQGRYKALLVDKHSHLLELCRYVLLNPVRAGLCAKAEDWQWSSCAAIFGKAARPDWLAIGTLLELFDAEPARARRAFRRFLREGLGADDPTQTARHQLYLGDEDFAERMAAKAKKIASKEIPRRQRAVKSLASYARAHPDRDTAMRAAYESGAYTQIEIGRHFGVHYSMVSRIVRGRLNA